MSTPTTINGFPKPDLSDSPNISTAVGNFADAIDSRVIPIFSTTGARDTAIPSPTYGMHCEVTGTQEYYRYNGTTWVSAAPRIIYKTANQSYSSDATLNPDDHFICNLEANSLYWGSIIVYYSSGTTSDFRTLWTFPSGCTGLRFYTALRPAAADTGDLDISVAKLSDTNQDFGGLGTTDSRTQRGMFDEQFTIDTAGSSGSLTFNHCQASATGTTTVFAGSCMQIWKVG